MDKQSPDEDEPTEPPAEPARFGWAQGVMVRTFKIAQKKHTRCVNHIKKQ